MLIGSSQVMVRFYMQNNTKGKLEQNHIAPFCQLSIFMLAKLQSGSVFKNL